MTNPCKVEEKKNTSPYTVLEEEQFKLGLKSGFCMGAGVGVIVGAILTALVIFTTL